MDEQKNMPQSVIIHKRKGLLISLVVVLLALGILFVLLWPKPPRMSVTFYTGDPAAPQTAIQIQSPYWNYLTITIQGAPSNTLFTWALYENHEVQRTYQWFFVEGTGSTGYLPAPDSTDGNGHCSWQIPIIAASRYDTQRFPSPTCWPTGQYEIKVTVTCPAPVTSNSVSEDSNIVSLLIIPPSS